MSLPRRSDEVRWRERQAHLRAGVEHLLHLGYGVFPLVCLLDGGCICHRGRDCKNPGKHPYFKGWRPWALNASTHQVLARWAPLREPWNLGIATGLQRDGSWLLVLDIDPQHGGWETLRRYPPLPEGPYVLTPSGGQHRYLRGVPGLTIGAGRSSPLGDGLDFRAEGGLVVAPLSVVAKGRYAGAADAPPCPAAELPACDWLVTLLLEQRDRRERKRQRSQAEHTPAPRRSYSSRGLPGWEESDRLDAEDWRINACALLMARDEGDRNDLLWSLAVKACAYVDDGLLDNDTTVEALRLAADEAGLDDDEVTSILDRLLPEGAS
jgi:hypothetical protein